MVTYTCKVKESQSKNTYKGVDIMFGITPYRGFGSRLPREFRGDFLDRMFDSMLEEFDDTYNPIKVDIKERDKEYLLEAEIPGVDKDDITLEIKDDILTLAVERKEEIDEEKENYIRKERRYGSFRRSFYIDDVDQDKIKAKFKNGVLKVKLPKKKTSSKENRIPIE